MDGEFDKVRGKFLYKGREYDVRLSITPEHVGLDARKIDEAVKIEWAFDKRLYATQIFRHFLDGKDGTLTNPVIHPFAYGVLLVSKDGHSS